VDPGGERVMMRRFPHGVTTRPGPARPGNGYGRITRPGPDRVRASRLLKVEVAVEVVAEVEVDLTSVDLRPR
jgi:hypothetical protein